MGKDVLHSVCEGGRGPRPHETSVARTHIVTLTAARAHGVPAIDATIGGNNTEGLAYYEAMGFCEYRRIKGAICEAYRLS